MGLSTESLFKHQKWGGHINSAWINQPCQDIDALAHMEH